jgi:hypothetical protein
LIMISYITTSGANFFVMNAFSNFEIHLISKLDLW